MMVTTQSDDRFKFKASAYAVFAMVFGAVFALSTIWPWTLLLGGLLAATALFGVWFKVGIRTGRWFWLDPRGAFTQGEGLVWISALVVFVPVITMVVLGSVMVHLPSNEPAGVARDGNPFEGDRGVSHSDPETQRRLKLALQAAGIPHHVKQRPGGPEFIMWSRVHDEAVRKIENDIQAGPLASGRNVSFGDPEEQRRFIDWLVEQKIGHEIVMSQGKSFVVWAADHADALERFRQFRTTDCERPNFDKTKKRAKRQRC
jgi:hypothetical protein